MPLDYNNNEAERLLESLYSEGFTQERVDQLYAALGLGTAPRVPAGLIGNRPGAGRAGMLILDSSGNRVGSRSGEINDFLNTFGQQAKDPFRVYGTGNYLGLAGMLVGGAGAAGAFNGAAAAAGGSGAGGGIASGATGTTSGIGAAGTGAGAANAAGAAGAAGGAAAGSGWAANSGLGLFANGGANGLAGLGGGNAGALAASGGIGGGAGIGGTTAGALGSLSPVANSLSGVGGNMGWDWGRALDFAGPLVGGWLEGQGSKDAARAQAQASAAGIAENRRQYDQTRTDMMPWLEAGRGALGQLQDPGANFTASPDYEFRRGEGMRGIENSFAARGGAASGNALRALTDFNSGLAGGEFGNWWNRQAGLAGVGQTASQNLGSLGANNSANIANLLGAQGDARASGIMGQTNALTNGLQGLLSLWKRGS